MLLGEWRAFAQAPPPPPPCPRRPAAAAAAPLQPRAAQQPYPKSQFLSQSCESVLPTSLTHILPSTRGCAPWRPAAVMGTTSRTSVHHMAVRVRAQIFTGCSARAKRSTSVCALPAIAAISPRNAIPWRAPATARAHAAAVRGCQGKETSLLGARSNVSGPACVAASALRARAGMLAGFPFSAMRPWPHCPRTV